MVNGVIGQIGVIVQNIVLEKVPKKEEQENVTVNGVWIMKVQNVLIQVPQVKTVTVIKLYLDTTLMKVTNWQMDML